MRRRALAIAALLAALAAVAWAGPDEEAAAHFARAEAAERRRDWRAAIGEYEAAYAASPHPAVLYNLAHAHEKLGEARAAARYYQRYLDEEDEPADRDEVETRIAALRERPARVAVSSSPSRAQVFVDGEGVAMTPTTLTLPAGRHELYAADGRQRSPTRALLIEYGEPVELRLELSDAPSGGAGTAPAGGSGLLLVAVAPTGAEVRIDGEVVGVTPFQGPVAAGPHRVKVSQAGHFDLERDITVPPDGSEQIRATLAPDGTAPPPAEANQRASGFFGLCYGGDVRGETFRYLLSIGARSSDQRVEAAFVFGAYQGGGGLGGEARLYAATGRVRPYLRGAGLVGTTDATEERTIGLEGGLGLLIVGQHSDVAGVDYFVEVNGHLALRRPEMSDEVRFGVPLVGGLVIRYHSDERR